MREASSPHTPGLSARPYRLLMFAIACVVLLAIGFVISFTWGSVITLGIVEGLTEFLPISSTAHLLISARLLGFRENIGGTFEVFIQLGAVLAVLGFYARDLLAQARALPTNAAARRFWVNIVVAFLPAAVIGVTLREWIKQVLFDSPSVIAWSLIVGGVIFILLERRRSVPSTTRSTEAISLRQALMIGIAQVFALIPGVSRSGASIVGAMLSGLDRPTATTFSFYLAIPTLGAATIVDLLASVGKLTSADIGRLTLGTLVAMVVAWFSIGWLLRYVARHNFVVFGIYRIAAGILILGLIATGIL